MLTLVLLRPIQELLPKAEELAEIGIRFVLTVLVAVVVLQLLNLVVWRIERWIARAGQNAPHAVQRAKTLGQTLRSLAAALVWTGAIVHVLDTLLNLDVKAILAGAGILGVALGFGAQTLVRDLIAGFFVLAEDQFGVGDVVAVAGIEATVEEVALRHTRLRDFHGAVHYVPNGEMKVVTNRSRGWNRIAVDVLVASDQDLSRALAVIRGVVDGMNADAAWRDRLLEPIELWGIESLVGQEVQVRTVLKALPGPNAPETARELRRRIHDALAEARVRTRSREIAIGPFPGRPPGAEPNPPAPPANPTATSDPPRS